MFMVKDAIAIVLSSDAKPQRYDIVNGVVEVDGIKGEAACNTLKSDEGVSADKRKIDSMLSWPQPTTVKGLRGFLDSFTWNEEAARAFSRVLMHTKSFLATDLLDHLPSGIKERASREPLCDLPLAESPADVALVLLPYRGLPFPNESFIQVVTLAKALRRNSNYAADRTGIRAPRQKLEA
ncbi:hypothetical protein Tco_1081781 [Tanacetum coccineum]|uniref:Uncharacterized protein n=1 Tax=Tanacetum coccineum TaxID=301880 RepID=A0ABQ5HZP1_9ASTR